MKIHELVFSSMEVKPDTLIVHIIPPLYLFQDLENFHYLEKEGFVIRAYRNVCYCMT